MQDTTLNVNLRGCQSTSTDPHAYTWEKQDNCLFAVREQIEGKMIKIGGNYYISIESEKNKAFYFKCTISFNHYVIAII